MPEKRRQLLVRLRRDVAQRPLVSRSPCPLVSLARPHHAPDAPAMPVALRVLQVHLVVPDDAVVEVRDIQRAVRAELQIDRMEPPVVARQKIFRLLDPRRRAAPLHDIAVDDVGDDVADEDVAVVLARELVGGIDRDSRDAGRAVVVPGRERHKPEAVVRLAEAVVVAAAQNQRQRLRVAVGREPVPQRVDRLTEGIHLAPRHLLDGRPVRLEPVRVARGHLQDHVTLTAQLDLRGIAEPVTRINPAIGGETKRVLVSVRIGEVKRPVQDFFFVGLHVAVSVGELPDMGDRPDDHLIAARKREHTNWNVQPVGESCRLRRFAIRSDSFEDGQPIASLLRIGGGERILDAVRDPQPPLRIERQIHRLLDVWLARHELNLKPGGELELGLLLGGSQRLRGRYGRTGQAQRGPTHEKQQHGGTADGERHHSSRSRRQRQEDYSASFRRSQSSLHRSA